MKIIVFPITYGTGKRTIRLFGIIDSSFSIVVQIPIKSAVFIHNHIETDELVCIESVVAAFASHG